MQGVPKKEKFLAAQTITTKPSRGLSGNKIDFIKKTVLHIVTERRQRRSDRRTRTGQRNTAQVQ